MTELGFGFRARPNLLYGLEQVNPPLKALFSPLSLFLACCFASCQALVQMCGEVKSP